MASAETITTGIDQLLGLVQSEKRITVDDAAKKLHVTTPTVEDWAALLEESGLISVEYKFRNMFLTPKKLTSDEQKKQKTTIDVDKRAFEAKSTNLGTYLDKLEEQLGELKELAADVKLRSMVPEELKKLKKLEREKGAADQELIGVRQRLVGRLHVLDRHLRGDQDRIQKTFVELLEQVTNTEDIITLNHRQSERLQENEQKLLKLMTKVSGLADKRIAKIMRKKGMLVGRSKEQAQALLKRVTALRQELRQDRAEFERLVGQSVDNQQEVETMHRTILGKLGQHRAKLYGVPPTKLQRFLKGRSVIGQMTSKIGLEIQLLRTKLSELAARSKILRPEPSFEQEMLRLTRDLAALDRKRDNLEKDIAALVARLK
ncbi:hypothetical protein HY493_01160 [Candidatus Woesearchaeota archaeon]|nr:hypothetical protein [Candidatus Woesearchaeota archaeon]